MDITEEQMPPDLNPPAPEKGVPPEPRPDTGSKPDLINPEAPDKDVEPDDPAPDVDPDGEDPVEDEVP